MKKLLDTLLDRFNATDPHSRALRTLKLRAGANRQEITRSYRELAARYHPDRGGDTDAFITIRQAYEFLR